MFFKKTEQKKHSACLILAVGALAAIGVASITKCGKTALCNMKCKIMSLFKKDGSSCSCNNGES